MTFVGPGAVGTAVQTDLTVTERIVLTLREYRRAIPVEFLAEVLGLQPSLIKEYLDALEKEHAIKWVEGEAGCEKVMLLER